MSLFRPYRPIARTSISWSFFSTIGLLLAFSFQSCQDYQPQIPEFDYAAISDSRYEAYALTDTTIKRLSTIKKMDERLDSLFYCIELIKNYDEVAALEYAKEAYRTATENGKVEGQAFSAYYLALLKGRQTIRGENLEGAIVDAKIAQKLFDKTDRDYWKVETKRLLGNLYYRKHEYDLATQHLLTALDLVKKYSLSQQEINISKSEIYHDLSSVYTDQDASYSQAIEYFEKSQEIYRLTGNQSSLARLMLDWGRLYTRMKEFSKADSFYQLSMEYALTNKDNQNIARVYERLGFSKYKQFVDTKNLEYFEASLAAFNKGLSLTKNNRYNFFNRIGSAYHAKVSSSIASTVDLDSAIINYVKALQAAQFEGVFDVMPKIVKNVSNLCNYRVDLLNEDCEGLLEVPHYKLLNDTYSAINSSVIVELEQANQKNNAFERTLLEVENNRRVRNQGILALTILLFTFLIFFIILQFIQQKRLKAKMEALRAQINPHFISNSLNAIESLVNLDQKDAASKYIIHFSRLTRRILNGSREASTTLKEELKTLEHFLALEQLRFRDKLHYDIQIEPEIKSELLEIPAMILQPYVENAIWHGIKPKDGSGVLQVNVLQSGKDLLIKIEDDGVGRAKAAELKTASVLKQKSVGMKINQERLKVIGKVKGAKMTVEDLFDPAGNPAGTRVVLRLPQKYKK